MRIFRGIFWILLFLFDTIVFPQEPYQITNYINHHLHLSELEDLNRLAKQHSIQPIREIVLGGLIYPFGIDSSITKIIAHDSIIDWSTIYTRELILANSYNQKEAEISKRILFKVQGLFSDIKRIIFIDGFKIEFAIDSSTKYDAEYELVKRIYKKQYSFLKNSFRCYENIRLNELRRITKRKGKFILSFSLGGGGSIEATFFYRKNKLFCNITEFIMV